MKIIAKALVVALAALCVSACARTGENYKVLSPLARPRIASASQVLYDESLVFTNSDFIFRGTILSLEEREYQWKDENGENWGPFYYTIYEIAVAEEVFASESAHEKMTAKGLDGTLKMVMPGNSYEMYEPYVSLDVGSAYILLSHVLDASDYENPEGIAQYDRFYFYKDADVYLQFKAYGVAPVSGDKAQVWSEIGVPGSPASSANAKLHDSSGVFTAAKSLTEADLEDVEDTWAALATQYQGDNALTEGGSVVGATP